MYHYTELTSGRDNVALGEAAVLAKRRAEYRNWRNRWHDWFLRGANVAIGCPDGFTEEEVRRFEEELAAEIKP